MISRIKGIIFDVDGTLLDSNRVWDNVGIEYLKSKGVIPEKNITNKLNNMGFIEAAEYFQSVYSIKQSVEDIIKSWNNIVKKRYIKEVSVKQNVTESLQYLTQKGIRLCCVSETSSDIMCDVLVYKGIAEHIDFFISCIDYNTSKNKFEIYDIATVKLGFNKHDVLVIEDSPYAINSANKGGYKVAGIYDDKYREVECDIKSKAYVYLNTIDELKLIIK